MLAREIENYQCKKISVICQCQPPAHPPIHTVREGHERLCNGGDGGVEDIQFAFVLAKS